MSKAVHIVGLDVGTSHIAAAVTEINAQGHPEILGLSVVPSQGVRKGVVVNPEQAAEPIRRAVEEAERMSGLAVDSVYVSLSGTSLRGLNNMGVIAITSPDRCITRSDVRRVIETACIVTLPGGHELIDVLPQEYIVDGQDGISDPIDMIGTRLEVSVHLITGPVTVRQNVIRAVNRAGLLVAGIVLEPIAAAEAVLTDDEREYGSAVVDIGCETTSLAVYQRGAVRHTAIFPLGGAHFTNDIAFGVRAPIPEAERIKRTFGCVLRAALPSQERVVIEVPSTNFRPPRSLSQEILCDLLQPRAEEIFHHVQDELRRVGCDRQLSSGVILTGGGALLKGLPELAEQMLDCPARLGYLHGVHGLTDEMHTPQWATTIGLVRVAHRGRPTHAYLEVNHPGRLVARTASKVKHWLGNWF